jgi:predicted TIM-barrel fold metal-dependent hydrolase
MVKAIDALNILLTPDSLKYWYPGIGSSHQRGVPIELYLERMDKASVEKAFLAANGGNGPPKWRIPSKLVIKYINNYPDRFSGLFGVDPLAGSAGLRKMEKSIVEHGFVGIVFYPHWFKLAPNNALMNKVYAKCIELDVPFMTQTCASFYNYLPAWVNQPILLEDVAMAFPNLKIVMTHGGWPWRDEAIMMAMRFPNIFLMPSILHPVSNWVNEWDPKMTFPNWGKELVHYIKATEGEKIIFGTNFPITDPVQHIKEFDKLGFNRNTKNNFLRENALKLFNLRP